MTLPAFWMERGNTRFWIPTSVTSAEPDDLVVSISKTLEIKNFRVCVMSGSDEYCQDQHMSTMLNVCNYDHQDPKNWWW